jgi:hypothetical protein
MQSRPVHRNPAAVLLFITTSLFLFDYNRRPVSAHLHLQEAGVGLPASQVSLS